MKFRIVLALLLVVATSMTVQAGSDPSQRSSSKPRLVLPGSHVVQTGQWIELQWTAAESVLELEILLSLDGGRTYSVCISPELDPKGRGFLWRVPELGARSLTMRIRFNCGAGEVEGPPTMLTVAGWEGQGPEPLGLPPLDRSEGRERQPRPIRDRGETPASRSAWSSFELEDETSLSGPSCDRWKTIVSEPRPILLQMDLPERGRIPAFVPMRA